MHVVRRGAEQTCVATMQSIALLMVMRSCKVRQRRCDLSSSTLGLGTAAGEDGAADASGTNMAVDTCGRVEVCCECFLSVTIPALGIRELVVVCIVVVVLVASPDDIVMTGTLCPAAWRTEGRHQAVFFAANGTGELFYFVGRLDAKPPFGLVERVCNGGGSGSDSRHG